MFRFVEKPENNEKHLDSKTKVKFKIVSLKVKAGIDYVPELVRLRDFNYVLLLNCNEHLMISCWVMFLGD